MPTYIYVAYDSSGNKVSSELECQSLDEAKILLTSQQLHIVTIRPKLAKTTFSLSLSTPKVTLAELEFLTSELSILLNSGVKIDKGLMILNKGKGPTAELISEIVKNIKSGMSVAESFDTKFKAFDPLYLNLISIGETTGQLPEVFSGLARDLKFQKDLRSKVTQALTYPSIILFVCIACILFVFNFIVPQMGSIFTDAENVPIYTQVLLSLSDWMQKYQLILFATIAGGLGFAYSNRNNKSWQLKVNSKILTMPILSGAVKQVEMIRFSSAMKIMLDAGIKVDKAIEHAIGNVKNQVIQKSIKIANDNIKKGATVSSSLAKTPIMPEFYVSLLEVGEESGNLSTIFGEISNRAKQDFEGWTTKMTNLLEPLLILVMGGIVGSVVVTMLLSVVSVNDISL